MKNSKIEWTDHTFNPWIGCTKVSPGCANCYAESLDKRWGHKSWGPGASRRRTSAANWRQPLAWNKAAEKAYLSLAHSTPAGTPIPFVRPRVFCASLADWLDDEVPIEWLADLLDMIRKTPHLDWLLLSKRPRNWDNRVGAACSWMSPLGPYAATKRWLFEWLGGWERENHRTPANIWIGTTVEDQARADERIPHLLRIPARVRFLSCEPLLGPVDCDFGHPKWRTAESYHSYIHWVICGGESGPRARPMHPAWARSLRDQCAAAGVPFFFKQWGEHDQNGKRVGKHTAGRLLDGKEHNAFPSP